MRSGTPLERGEELGRYVVLSRLGQGGMGIVYEAYDPELNRKLAIKLLHPLGRKKSEEKAAEQRLRLLREAQAMARLTHPNVITVHDVGPYEDGVFVAMEFVDGSTLGKWLETERPWTEVLAVFTKAANGLAAAHRADLIHRDFKPENVMVANDGRVLVMDFGLARGVGEVEDEIDESSDPITTGRVDVLDTNLTRAGAIMGTPAYMAPEQHMGMPADGKSDQFSFCISFWEGLYGQRPFGGNSPASLALQMSEGEILEPARTRDVPTWLRKVLERGLSVSPDERWPSMEILAAELARDHEGGRRRVWWGLGLAAVLAGSYAVVSAGDDDDSVCRGAERELGGIWDAETKKRVEAAMVSTGRGYAQASYDAVARHLDAYAQQWTTSHRAACEATWVRGEQSERLLDLRMACLDGRRAAMAALVELLAQADDDVLEHAVAATEDLPPIDRCDDLALLSAQVRPPASQADVDRVGEIRERLDEARALETSTKYDEGLELARAADEQARGIDYLPIQAEARFSLALLERESGHYPEGARLLFETIELAEQAHHDELRADAWIELVTTVGGYQGEPGRALELLGIASATTRRLGEGQESRLFELAHLRAEMLRRVDRLDEAREAYDSALEMHEALHGEDNLESVRLLTGLANVLSRQGKYEEALEHKRRGLALQEAQLGPDHPQLAETIKSLGRTLGDMGRDEEALEHHRRALEIRQASLGPDHPRTASAHSALGNRLEQIGRYDEALEQLDRALAIREARLGENHPDLAPTLNSLGNVYHNLERQDEALAHFRRAREINIRVLGPEHATVAFNTQNIGNALKSKGDYAAAREAYEEALRIKRKVLGPRHHSTGGTTHNLADLFMKMGELDKAKAGFEDALSIKREAVGNDHPRLGSTLTGLGELHLKMRQPAKALEYLEDALRIRESRPTPAQTLAGTRFLAARALWDSGGDRERAMKLALAARDVNHRFGESRARELAECEAWLRKRGWRPPKD